VTSRIMNSRVAAGFPGKFAAEQGESFGSGDRTHLSIE
jgi:hypothetical protein